MLNLIYADLYKLTKSTAIKVCFLISCVCAVVLTLISHNIATGSMSADISGSASGLMDIMVLSLLGSLMAGYFICCDFETKTIHDAVACGNGRISVVLSKALGYGLIVVVLLLPYAVVAFAGFCTGAEFTAFGPSVFLNILANETGIAVTGSSIGKIIVVYLVTSIVYVARLSICLPIAFKVRKPVIVLAFGFTASFLIDLVRSTSEHIPILRDIIMKTPYSIGSDVINMKSGVGTILEATGISIIFFVIMTVITYLLFRRAEIK